VLQNLPQIFSDLCYGAVTVVFKRRRRMAVVVGCPGSGSAGEPAPATVDTVVQGVENLCKLLPFWRR
jgi:hypothetical protein